MTAIKGLSEMILEGDYGKVNEKMKRPLENIHISSVRQVHLINELLDVSRLQTGMITYRLQESSLQDILSEVVTALHAMTKRKKVKLVLKPFADQIIQADQTWVKQILHNIIGNALKYTEKGTVTVSVHHTKEFSFITVVDTGVGIAESEQEKLFGRFRQLHNDATIRAMGSGLGLFIARSVARQMGGDIILEKSSVGQGSTFVFSIPNAGTDLAQKIRTEIQIANNERKS
jgi:signal transduction histidine kinase